MSRFLDRAISASMVFACLAIGVAVLYRTFHGVHRDPGQEIQPTREFVPYWKESLKVGRTVMGDSTAPMTIVELTDLECPYCRAFQASLDSLLDARPGAIRLVYVPFPLPIHRFADQAAKAAECAADAGGLRGWIKTVYANQDSLGLKTWSSIAQAAGLSHPELIERCAKAAGSNERLLAAHEFGRKLGLKGTPLIMANGWKYSFPPTRRILDSLVKEAIGEKAK